MKLTKFEKRWSKIADIVFIFSIPISAIILILSYFIDIPNAHETFIGVLVTFIASQYIRKIEL